MQKIKIFNYQNKFWVATWITVVVLLSIYFLSNFFFFDIFSKINLSFQNWLYNKDLKWKIANKSIVVVEIDDRTLQDPEKWWLGRWQEFRRTYFAKVIDNLKRDNALVIWVDVLFSEKWAFHKEDDKTLSQSIKNAWNVILAFHKINKLYPIDSLRSAASGIWDVFTIVNKSNQNVYSIHPYYSDDWAKSFALSVLDRYFTEIYWEKQSQVINAGSNTYFDFYWTKIPFSRQDDLSPSKELLINYISRPTDFQKLSFVDVYNNKYDSNSLKDKIVLIGSSATWLHDEYLSPIRIIPWVYTHANAINTVLNKIFISYFNSYSEIWILILFVYLITILWIYDARKYYFVSSLFILIIAYLWFYDYAFKTYNSIFSFPIQFFISIVLSFLMVSIFRYLYEDKWKRLLQWALSQYLAEDLVKWVLHNYEKVKLWGQKMENTIFFSDVAWFTSISEKMEPEELVMFLSDYLKEVSDVIIDNKWFINKYEWDAVMALWWAFWLEAKQAYLACKSALEQQKTIDALNSIFKDKYGFEIKVRMWINKWPVIVWNIWSEWRKIEFTALWDNVNLASRLEWINKFYWTLICVSESVKQAAWDEFVYRFLDKIKVKWKKINSNIYELIWYRSEVPQEKLNLIKEFDRAWLLYSERKFKEAKAAFAELFDLWDVPSVAFMKRCMEFEKNNPWTNWDWSWEFSEK
ncbi:MAG: hypothetical protein ACD_2C00050G0007 [uncultured bacterium (gcode 4)]|uniref:Guanylate cyclase domain-containing protein n=1 Tax=uncultured bacterium (gcode 4) TaxID=1234023 RepID=K2G6V6_9BACT|nr:MAG: hypothetical protein ACD_2C00050G0007 [uncultured bacterium (gcode 4)]